MKRGTRFRGFSCAVEIDEELLKGAGMLAYSNVKKIINYGCKYKIKIRIIVFYKDNIAKIFF